MRSEALALIALLAPLAACGEATTPDYAVRACLAPSVAPDPANPSAGLAAVPAGRATIGDDPMQPEEGPPREVELAAFFIDPTAVTNRQFAAFVAATGYVTYAERAEPKGSLVFFGASGMVDLNDPGQWWRFVNGASWRRPWGPGSSIDGLEELPVVHVAYEDALAYARWAGRDLPTEAEWEYAARGGRAGARYVWGDAPASDRDANVWQGIFPLQDRGADGFAARVAPVGCYAPNGFGLYDMAGNVWQWTSDLWPGAGGETPERVLKGGSFLCSDSYCYRFRPVARTGAGEGDGASHIGFRTVYRPNTEDRRTAAAGGPP